MARLFDDIVRSDLERSLYAEGRFSYLNRAAQPAFGLVRDLLEGWFADHPPAGQADIRSRARSRVEGEFNSAFWELYLAQTLRRTGFSLTYHPEVPGSTHHPDFLVERSGASFYLEAIAARESPEEVASDRRLAVLKDVIDRCASDKVYVSMDVLERGPRAPRTTGLRRRLVAWLDALDPDALLTAPDLSGAAEAAGWTWAEAGWRIRFEPIPKRPDARRADGPLLGIRPTDQVATSTPRPGSARPSARRPLGMATSTGHTLSPSCARTSSSTATTSSMRCSGASRIGSRWARKA